MKSLYLCFSWVCWYNFTSSDEPDLAVAGLRNNITATLQRGSCDRRYYLAQSRNFLANKPHINIRYENIVQKTLRNSICTLYILTRILGVYLLKLNIFLFQSAPGLLTTWRGSHVPGQTGEAGSAALTTGLFVTASTTARTRRTRTPTTVSSTKR